MSEAGISEDPGCLRAKDSIRTSQSSPSGKGECLAMLQRNKGHRHQLTAIPVACHSGLAQLR